MRILFADALATNQLAPLRSAGHEVIVDASLGADDLPGAIPGADVVVVRSTKITAATIAAADALSLIVRAGAGTDNIDTVAASDKGIYVCNVPGKNAIAVAELAMALLLSVDRHIADGAADLRGGQWNKGRYSNADGLHGKRMAIIGLGEIGLAVAERASAFGIQVVAMHKAERSQGTNDRIAALDVELVDSRATLLKNTDIVSIHVPGGASTVGLVDAEFLAQLPDNAIVINTSRGNVIDDNAMLEALNHRGFRLGADVWNDEPKTKAGDFASPLAQHPSVVGSHHIGASTQQAQNAVASGVVDVVMRFAQGGVANCINLVTTPQGRACLVVRHHDQVGVLAAILQELRAGGINVQQMSNQIFEGGRAAVATIHLSDSPNANLVAKIIGLDHVLAITTSNPAV